MTFRWDCVGFTRMHPVVARNFGVENIDRFLRTTEDLDGQPSNFLRILGLLRSSAAWKQFYAYDWH